MTISSQPRLSGGSRLHNARILIADSDETIRRTLKGFIERRGHHVVETTSGQEALDHISRQDFDLVFADLNMLVADGNHLLQTAHPLAPDTVFIVLTGYSTVNAAALAVRRGAFSYLLKPSPENQIARVLDAGLTERRYLLGNRVRKTPPGLTAVDIEVEAPLRELPASLEHLTETTDFSGDHLWELGDYLARAFSAFETRMHRRVVGAVSPPSRPYRLLYPFEIEDAALLFGRAAAVDALYEQVLGARLTVVHGKSGVGKTSLLNAGLSPRLIREGRLPVYAPVNGDPLRAIKQAIAPPFLEPWPDGLDEFSLQQMLKLGCDHLSSQTHELVIILDRFEEFLIFWPQREQRQGFVDVLAACLDDTSLPIRFIIALRAEYLSDLAQFQGSIPSILQNQFWLDVLTGDEAREAITGPLDKLDLVAHFEPALLDALLTDLNLGGPILSPGPSFGDTAHSAAQCVQPPQLQMVCHTLYEGLGENENTITLARYEQLGRAAGILDGYLPRLLDRLSQRRAAVAREILKELVSSHATGRELSERALAAQVDADAGELAYILTWLVEARIVRHSEITGESLYQLSHGYLLQEISEWIDPEDLARKRVQELLKRELVQWRSRDTLPSRNQLEALLAHREQLSALHTDALRFLLRAALKAGSDVEEWARLAGESGEEILLDALLDPQEGIRKAAIRSLGLIWQLSEVSDLTAERADIRRAAAARLGDLVDPRAIRPLVMTLNDEAAEVRTAAARALGQLGDGRTVGPIIPLLTDQDRGVQLAAVSALGALGDDRAVDALINVLVDPDHEVRRAVIRALGAIWGFPELVALGDEDRYVVWAAARRLGELGDPRAVGALITVLRDDHRGLRRAAAAALVEMGELALDRLIVMLREEDWDVRRTAVEALGEIRESRALEPLHFALRDKHPDVRAAAAASLVKLGPRALQPLLAALTDKDSALRAQAAAALGELGEPAAVEPLAAALRDVSSRVREAASEALVNLGQPAVKALIVALKDEDHYVRRAAASALGQIGASDAVDPLIVALDDQNPDVRRAAANALERIGDPRTLEPFIAALADNDRFVRREAAWALGESGAADAIAPLIAVLRDKDRGVRQAAAAALAKLGEPAVEPLNAAMQDEDAAVRWAIAGVLGQLGDPRAVESLVAALKDADAVVRRAAASSLGKIGDTRSVEPLIALLLDEESGVRWAAIIALGDLGDPRAVDGLSAALGDKDTSLSRAAAEALKKIGTSNALDALNE